MNQYFNPMIKFNQISKKFGKLQALDSVDLELKGSSVTAIIGPNGAGKTTLMKTLLGLVLPDSGHISIDDKTVTGAWDYKRQLGYMSQISRFPENISIRELFAMMKDIRSDCHTYDYELWDIFKLDQMSDKKLGALSGGTKQKVNGALAFLFRPQILILDEPTAGLDPVATEQIKQNIQKEKKNGKLIIITSHIMSDIEELADTIVYIINGRVLFSRSINEVKKQTGEQSFSKAMAKVTEMYL